MGKNEEDRKIQTKYLPTKFTLTVRILVGAYLLYTSYSLIDGVMTGEGRDKYFFAIFMIAFTIIGILLIIFAGRDLLRGRYVDGAMDAGESAAAEENAAVESIAAESGAEEIVADSILESAETESRAEAPAAEKDVEPEKEDKP